LLQKVAEAEESIKVHAQVLRLGLMGAQEVAVEAVEMHKHQALVLH
jgi:hypothetical protein